MRTGEFHEDEIIELSPGDIFQSCHFYNCTFVGSCLAHYYDCVFLGGSVKGEYFNKCLFWSA